MEPPMSLMFRTALLLACLLSLGMASGCNYLGFLGQAGRADEEIYEVSGQYLGLEGKSIAVMVVADEYLLFNYPHAQLGVARAVSARLADNMPTVTVMDPAQILAFQNNNPYWHAIAYGELIQKMRVDAIVLIDLIEYQTHEPGNAHIWQGQITGNVGVILADSPTPDDFVFYTAVRALFPEDRAVGIINSDEQTIQLGMLSIFSRDAGGLFYDHTIVKPR